MSVKPRAVDFELFHQSKEAENCYGPFRTGDFSDTQLSFGWADDRKLIWEGFLDRAASSTSTDLVMRIEFYVGERDLFGLGFSDNIVFTKQYYVRAILEPTLQLYLYTGEEFTPKKRDDSLKISDDPQQSSDDLLEKATPMQRVDDGWEFEVSGTGFVGKYRIELDLIP